MADPQEGQSQSGKEAKSRNNSVTDETAAGSPFQAQLPSDTASGKSSVGAHYTATNGDSQQTSRAGSRSNENSAMPDISRSSSSGINTGSDKIDELASEAPVPSTSTLPVLSGVPINHYSQSKSSLAGSSSSSSPSLPPTATQLLKGKQKEGSVPLSPFGQNDLNNSRADTDVRNYPSNALKAFVRPEAGNTQIAAATVDMNPASGLSAQKPWPTSVQDISASLDSFSLPSEGLFPSDGSDMADLFGPGSAALFEQIRAAMRESPEAPPWVPPEQPAKKAMPELVEAVEAEKKDDSDDSDSDNEMDLAFNFDLDAQINAAMASLTESVQATIPTPVQVQKALPESVTAQAADKSAENISEASAVPVKVIPLSTHSTEQEKAPAAPQGTRMQDQEAQSDSDDDDNDAAAAAAQFDLDAMLASAMGQATGASLQADVGTVETASKEKTPAAKPLQANVLSSSSSDTSEDEEQVPVFDLDAHLRQAMALARDQASLSPGEEVIDVGTPLGPPSSDESSDNEGAFDLDAHIGQALADQLLASVQQQAPRQSNQPSHPAAPKEPSPDFMAHDLQNMLQAAMKQAALELEDEQQEQTIQLEGMTLAAREQAQAFPDQPAQPPPFVPRRFAMPPKPRTRPRVEDDGDPDNAFNRSRQAHPQALHTSFKCDFKGCDTVFARLQDFQLHRQGHQGPKPFKCHLCPATFTTNQEFQDHSWTHNRTREWKYRCKGCFNLFGGKGMFDQHVSKAKDYRCSRGECELQMRPAGARVTMPPIEPTNGHLSKANHENYFVQSGFDQSALLAATLVHQMSSLLARQYDRQTSLLGPNDPKIDANLALQQTFQRAGLTPNETAALATILASVGHARNEGLKASLDEARKAQFEAYRKHQERQRKAALKQIKRERKRIKQAADKAATQDRRKADQAAQAERKKQAEASKNGDIPVPQAAVMT